MAGKGKIIERYDKKIPELVRMIPIHSVAHSIAKEENWTEQERAKIIETAKGYLKYLLTNQKKMTPKQLEDFNRFFMKSKLLRNAFYHPSYTFDGQLFDFHKQDGTIVDIKRKSGKFYEIMKDGSEKETDLMEKSKYLLKMEDRIIEGKKYPIFRDVVKSLTDEEAREHKRKIKKRVGEGTSYYRWGISEWKRKDLAGTLLALSFSKVFPKKGSIFRKLDVSLKDKVFVSELLSHLNHPNF